ncbi:deoxyribonuclease IV [Paenibacillus sp. CN-4]|uniref:deoxyribonuclease IV n=1 Tax=Paenibacillus nanchangensis TaxID=3348343 RepID=UPI0039784E04
MNAKPVIGCHVSIRGGYRDAARAARETGAGGFQYFPKNPRSLEPKAFDARDARACAEYCKEHGLVSIAHTPYPTNLAAAGVGADSRARHAASLRNDLEIAEACGSIGIVVHFGSVKETDPVGSYREMIECLNEVLDGWSGRTLLLIENLAGNRGPAGTTLEELVTIRRLARRPECIGFCFDTCHAFASGLWKPEATGDLLRHGSELGYWPEVKAVHLNDSRYGYASRRDRHARTGEGHIGLEALLALLKTDELNGVPAILETDKGPDGTHREEIGRLLDRLKG